MKQFFFLLFLLATMMCEAAVEDHFKPCLNKTEAPQIPEIDFVYLINLDRRPDRYARCLEQLQPYGITPYRFSAVDAKELSQQALEDVGVSFQKGMAEGQWVLHYPSYLHGLSEYDFLRKECYGKTYFSQWTRKGAIGCALSHLSVLQDALTSEYETIWILEDDFLIKRDPRTVAKYINALDSLVGRDGWDVLYTDDLGGISPPDHRCGQKKDFWFLWRPDVISYDYASYGERTFLDHDIVKIGGRSLTHSMIVRRSGMEKILAFEKRYHIFLPYDNELTLIPSLHLFSLTDAIVTLIPESGSDIQGS